MRASTLFVLTPLVILGAVAGIQRRSYAGGSDEAAVRKVLDEFVTAFRAKDIDKVMALYAHTDDLVIFDVVPPRQYTGWNAYRKDFQRMFDGFDGPIGAEMTDVTITCDGAMAFSHAINHVTGTSKKGEKIDHTVRVTDVYRKVGGAWKIVHEHVSLPVNLATGKADLHAAP